MTCLCSVFCTDSENCHQKAWKRPQSRKTAPRTAKIRQNKFMFMCPFPGASPTKRAHKLFLQGHEKGPKVDARSSRCHFWPHNFAQIPKMATKRPGDAARPPKSDPKFPDQKLQNQTQNVWFVCFLGSLIRGFIPPTSLGELL